MTEERTGPWRVLFLAVVLILIAAAAFTARAEEGPRRSVPEVLRYFDTIVFGSEAFPEFAADRIAKWEGPVSIGIRGRVVPRYAKMLMSHLQRLAWATGLRFDPFLSDREKGRAAGIDVVFLKKAEMKNVMIPGVEKRIIDDLAASGGCYFLTFRKPESRIVKGVVVVNVERTDAAIDHCLLEELTQTMGLPNDSDLLRPSLFSDRDRLVEYAPVDRLLIRTLYDHRMAAGLPREKALLVARTILTELMTAPEKP